MIRRVLASVASALPKRLITRDDGNPYLERYYLFGDVGGLKYFAPDQQRPRWWQKALTWLPCVYLHRFAASDSDPEYHSHPWAATSLILAGGYVEERCVPASAPGVGRLRRGSRRGKRLKIVEKRVMPWSVNHLDEETFHRVTLVEGDCWSLIKIGKKTATWGFLDADSGEFLHWREHLERRKARVNARGGNV